MSTTPTRRLSVNTALSSADPDPSPPWVKVPDKKWVKINVPKEDPFPIVTLYPSLTRETQKTPASPLDSSRVAFSNRTEALPDPIEIPSETFLDSRQPTSEVEFSTQNTDRSNSSQKRTSLDVKISVDEKEPPQKSEEPFNLTKKIEALVGSCFGCCSCCGKLEKNS
jgi:hypothetical protein